MIENENISFLEISNEELNELLLVINKEYGYDFSDYARASIKRRIRRFMNIHNIHSLRELQNAIINNENLFTHFVEEITVTVTEMFRDPSFYCSIRDKVIPQLATYPYIRIWNAGCSTGEEVYSMAILLQEEGIYDRTLIYGTDINQEAINKAKEGIIPLSAIEGYKENYLKSGGSQSFSDYYISKYDRAIFDRSLKKNLIFAIHNLVTDQSFNEFNLIVCRNVLIYFNKNLQNKVIKLFYDSLSMFGYLALSSKESLLFSEYKNKFEVIDKHESIYKKIG